MNYIFKFKIGQIAYFKLDKDQNPMFVFSIWVREDSVQYQCRDVFSGLEYYSEFELSETEDILTKIK